MLFIWFVTQQLIINQKPFFKYFTYLSFYLQLLYMIIEYKNKVRELQWEHAVVYPIVGGDRQSEKNFPKNKIILSLIPYSSASVCTVVVRTSELLFGRTIRFVLQNSRIF